MLKVESESENNPPRETEPLAPTHTWVDVEDCAFFFGSPLDDAVQDNVLPLVIVESSQKRRTVLEAAHAALSILLCVEGVPAAASGLTAFALAVWCVEVSVASFFNAGVLDTHNEGHVRAFWQLVNRIAFLRKRGSETHPLQRAARVAWRGRESGEAGDSSVEFEEAKAIVRDSKSVMLVMRAGCMNANAR